MSTVHLIAFCQFQVSLHCFSEMKTTVAAFCTLKCLTDVSALPIEEEGEAASGSCSVGIELRSLHAENLMSPAEHCYQTMVWKPFEYCLVCSLPSFWYEFSQELQIALLSLSFFLYLKGSNLHAISPALDLKFYQPPLL